MSPTAPLRAVRQLFALADYSRSAGWSRRAALTDGADANHRRVRRRRREDHVAHARLTAQDLGDLRRRDPQRRRDNADAAGGIQLGQYRSYRGRRRRERGHQPHLLRADIKPLRCCRQLMVASPKPTASSCPGCRMPISDCALAPIPQPGIHRRGVERRQLRGQS